MCAELIGTAFADRLYKKEYEMIQENILELVKYGLSTGLVDPEDPARSQRGAYRHAQ